MSTYSCLTFLLHFVVYMVSIFYLNITLKKNYIILSDTVFLLILIFIFITAYSHHFYTYMITLYHTAYLNDHKYMYNVYATLKQNFWESHSPHCTLMRENWFFVPISKISNFLVIKPSDISTLIWENLIRHI